MTTERRDRLIAAGLDLDGALERVLGSEALLERLLGKFTADKNFDALGSALAGGDAQRAYAAAHTLKGVCGNLSMTALYELFTRQSDALRRGDLDAGAALMGEIAPAYERMAAAISGADDGEG